MRRGHERKQVGNGGKAKQGRLGVASPCKAGSQSRRGEDMQGNQSGRRGKARQGQTIQAVRQVARSQEVLSGRHAGELKRPQARETFRQASRGHEMQAR